MPRGPLPPKFAGRGPRPFGSFLGSGLAPAAINRYFRTNDDLSYCSIPEVTFSGAFSISLLMYPANARAHLLANNAGGDRLFYEEASNKIELFINGAAVSFTGNPPLNTLSLLTISRDSSNQFTCVLNGTSLPITSGQGEAGSFTFNSIGDQFANPTSVPNFEGIIANVLMYDNGTLVRNYSINDNSNIIANAAASLGPELVTNGDFSDGTNNWGAGSDAVLSEIGGVLTVSVTSPDTFGNAFQSIDTEVGKEYLVEIDVRGSTGAANILCGISPTPTGTRTILNLDGSGQNELRRGTFTGDGSTVYLQLGTFGDGSSASYGSAGVKEAPGYGSVVNGNASDWELFNQQSDGDYLGQEQWIDSLVNTTGLATYSNGVGHVINTAALELANVVVDTAITGFEYRFALEVFEFDTNLSDGLYKIGTDATGVVINSDGFKTSDITADRSEIEVKRATGNQVDFKFRNTSVKRLLRVA